MDQLNKSKIKNVWDIFQQISKIPRGSGEEKAVSDWIAAFAKQHNLVVVQDKFNNILIKKPATAGYEKYTPIILQGHMDMVNEKTIDSTHDFTRDPIKLKVENGFLRAHDTTLGADNGIGVSFILAYLTAPGLQHPAIEAILTTEEETTMNGAKNFDYSQIAGRHLISLDDTQEGTMMTACAGIVKLQMNGDYAAAECAQDSKIIEIVLTGLTGGHSGNDIVIRPAAFQFLARTLYAIREKLEFQICNIHCGTKPNAISRDFKLAVAINAEQLNSVKEIVAALSLEFNAELVKYNEKISMQINEVTDKTTCASPKDTNRMLDLFMTLPNGMQTMLEAPDVAENSLNIGQTNVGFGKIALGITIRSAVKTLETYVLNRLRVIAKTFDMSVTIDAVSPSFSSPGSDLANLCADTYMRLYGKPIMNKRIHALVEAGVFQQNIPDIQIVMIAPNLYDIHSPSERLDIESAERTWDLFVELIKNAKFQ
ncbi:MAG: beta-Ala-His dipeptidase [Alphaproteobacteria bacterium]|nr:beta-Ala-His dipeptidase [Alphaproteobacteria bacterium]